VGSMHLVFCRNPAAKPHRTWRQLNCCLVRSFFWVNLSILHGLLLGRSGSLPGVWEIFGKIVFHRNRSSTGNQNAPAKSSWAKTPLTKPHGVFTKRHGGIGASRQDGWRARGRPPGSAGHSRPGAGNGGKCSEKRDFGCRCRACAANRSGLAGCAGGPGGGVPVLPAGLQHFPLFCARARLCARVLLVLPSRGGQAV
jgi:hypothetical protein